MRTRTPFVPTKKALAISVAAVLSLTIACGEARDDVYNDLSQQIGEMPLVPLAAPCTFADTGMAAGTATIALAATGEAVLVSRRIVDSAILVNGSPCGTATATSMKKLNVTGGIGNDTVIVDYLYGTFGAGTTAGAGVIVDLGSGADAFLLHADQSPFGFAHLLSAVDFMQRGPLEIVFAGEHAQSALWPLLETVHRAYLPARVLALAEDVPIGAGRHPVDGQPAAYVCRNRTGDAPLTTVEALRERCAT